MAAQYNFWNKKKDRIKASCDNLPRTDDAQELNQVYVRHLEIIEKILSELSHEFNDEQYTETTSWHYESELLELNEKQAKLEPIVQQQIEADEHQNLLNNMQMNQEQYDNYLRNDISKRKTVKNSKK